MIGFHQFLTSITKDSELATAEDCLDVLHETFAKWGEKLDPEIWGNDFGENMWKAVEKWLNDKVLK